MLSAKAKSFWMAVIPALITAIGAAGVGYFQYMETKSNDLHLRWSIDKSYFLVKRVTDSNSEELEKLEDRVRDLEEQLRGLASTPHPRSKPKYEDAASTRQFLPDALPKALL